MQTGSQNWKKIKFSLAIDMIQRYQGSQCLTPSKFSFSDDLLTFQVVRKCSSKGCK